MTGQAEGFHFVELNFAAAIEDRSALPPFLGATLRGALGYLLKQTVCQVAHGDCDRCVLQTACPYPAIFEGRPPAERDFMRKYPRIPQPFVLLVPPPEAPVSGHADMLIWGVRLFGSACGYWPYLVHVFQEAGTRGIGRQRVRFELQHVSDGATGEPLWSHDSDEWSQPQRQSQALPRPLPEQCALRWTFHTPVRFRKEGSCSVREVDGLAILMAGRRRHDIMANFYGTRSESERKYFEQDQFVTHDVSLRSYEFQRFSGRQRRKMLLQGLIGDIVIEGPWSQCGDWLHAIPLIHLGKATSFGFGRVTWEVA